MKNDNENTRLLDTYLTHAIYLERYKNHEANALLAILDTANKQIQKLLSTAKSIETKQKYIQVSRQIKKITTELREQLDGQLKLDFLDLIEEETEFVQEAVNTAIKDSDVGGSSGRDVVLDTTLPAPKKVWAAASFGPYTGSGAETFESYLNGLSENLYKTWDSQVRSGYLTGMTADQINRAVLGSVKDLDPGLMQSLKKSLETNTKTMIAHMAENARDAVYKENESIFSGYVYLATLDTRTCPVCGTKDGKVYESLDKAPVLPSHLSCRCLLLPQIKGREGLELEERASVDGPVDGSMTWKDWLAKQDAGRQMDILGPTRYAMYKAGLDTGSFVTDKRMMTLKELQESFYGTPSKTIETQLGIKNSNARSFESAIKYSNHYYHTNPEYRDNCQRCVPVYELRRRGYDVMAMPRITTPGFDKLQDGSECFTDQSGNPIQVIRASKGKQDLIEQLKTYPDGARFGIKQVLRKYGWGHVYVAEKVNGEIKFADPQNGSLNAEGLLDIIGKSRHSKQYKLWYYRMDDALLNSALNWQLIVEARK